MRIFIEDRELTPEEVERVRRIPIHDDGLDTTDMNRIMARSEIGLPPLPNETEAEREFRLRVTPQIAEIKARGGCVEYIAEPS